ncbi:hypothetical protein [Tunturibacter empetritectus]|uniref:Uncharacterized protein n=1 Tax=Tunturiibacter lichenicola TaxID=2051959 RepID=A0A7W8J4F2_9BACT|nr:hypothetical protein [Edaphobacter lichenicola]MBB5342371.1 hypothetical protein [Edaphobacter lichenicola]
MACTAGMLRVFFRLRAVTVAALLAASMAWGQTASSAGSQTVTDVLHEMSDRAGVIFMGQVLAVRLPGSAGPASGIVEVDFRVDQAILGCRTGEPYVLREWGGLWAGGGQRYRVGQRLLMLLHAPSAGGMSSPIGGLDGAIPIRQSAVAGPVMAGAMAERAMAERAVAERAVAERAGGPPSSPFVDLRWLGAKVRRTVSYRSEAVGHANTFSQPGAAERQAGQVVAAGSSVSDVSMVLPLGYTSAADASVPAPQASVDTVLGLLNSWQKAQHVTP